MESGPAGANVVYAVDVDRVFKGGLGPEAEIVTASTGATCGLPDLPEGEPLLFFADIEGADLTVNSCGGTGEAQRDNLAAVTALLGEPRDPAPVPDDYVGVPESGDDSTNVTPWLLGGGLLAAAAVGGFLFRKRRSP